MRFADHKRAGQHLAYLVALFLLALPPVSQAAEEQQQVVVHLSHYSDDLHSVSMALELGTTLAEAGAQVTLFCDLEGVRLADRRVPQNLRWGNGKAVGDLYRAFLAAGGSVLLCPHCVRAAGISTEQVREGSRIGTKKAVADLFLDADKILDY